MSRSSTVYAGPPCGRRAVDLRDSASARKPTWPRLMPSSGIAGRATPRRAGTCRRRRGRPSARRPRSGPDRLGHRQRRPGQPRCRRDQSSGGTSGRCRRRSEPCDQPGGGRDRRRAAMWVSTATRRVTAACVRLPLSHRASMPGALPRLTRARRSRRRPLAVTRRRRSRRRTPGCRSARAAGWPPPRAAVQPMRAGGRGDTVHRLGAAPVADHPARRRPAPGPPRTAA